MTAKQKYTNKLELISKYGSRKLWLAIGIILLNFFLVIKGKYNDSYFTFCEIMFFGYAGSNVGYQFINRLKGKK